MVAPSSHPDRRRHGHGVDHDRRRRRQDDALRLRRSRQQLRGAAVERTEPETARRGERRDRAYEHGEAKWPHGDIVADG
jgi:hypothetical protein